MKVSIPPDLTIIIPAFNEERNLAAAVESVKHALRRYSGGYTILIINDGSTDGTADIAQLLTRQDTRIRVTHNTHNKGLGYSFRRALLKVKTRYVTIFPGDNDMSAESVTRLSNERKSAGLVTGYMINSANRSWERRALSRIYVIAMNALFGLRLRYYNGPFLCNAARLRALPLRSNGLDIFAEMKIRMIRSGCSVKEVPFEHTGRKHGISKAVTWKSLMQTIRTTIILLWDIKLPPYVN